MCENIGTRLCTLDEIKAKDAIGHGNDNCNRDYQYVWSSSDCGDGKRSYRSYSVRGSMMISRA